MGIEFKVNVKRKFTVNGNTYGSLEEMPPELRQAFEKTISGAASARLAVTTSKVVFNGKVYESVNEMSPEERQLYEDTLKLIQEKNGPLPPEAVLPSTKSQRPSAGPKVVEVGSPVSLRLAFFGLLLLGMVLAAWWILKTFV